MRKTILKIISVGALFLVLLVIAASFFLNTNQYKSALQDSILAATGYELIIGGDLEVNLFPPMGLILNDVRVKNPAFPQELASTSAISLRVDAGELFRGQLLIQEFTADDFHINYYTNAQGRNIWDVETPLVDDNVAQQQGLSNSAAANSSATAQQGSDTDDSITASFERIVIANASIDIQDLSTGTNLIIRNLDLDSRDTNIEGRPFALAITFDFLNNGMTTPMAMGFRSNISADINSGQVSINDINLNLTPMLLQGDIQLSDISNELAIEGQFRSNTFDPVGLLETLGITEPSEEFTAPNIGTQTPQVAIAFNFNGDQTQLVIPSFTANMGITKVQADANVHYATAFAPANISYDVIVNSIDVSPFMTSADEDIAATESSVVTASDTTVFIPAATASQALDTPLHLDALNAVNVLGAVSIQALSTNSLEFHDVNIFTNLEGGQLDIEIQPIGIFGGTIQGNLRLNSSGNSTELSTQVLLSEIDVAELVPRVPQLNTVTGKLNAEMDYSASGGSINAMLDSLNGSTTFAVTENSVDIGLLKQVFTGITALSPDGDSVQQWPDVIQFSELGGYLLFEDGIDANQQLKLRMDNFDISGTGGINLAERSFDYDMQFTILGEPAPQTIQINQRYLNVEWPVTCSAAVSDPVSQYCGADFTRVREIFTRMATNELKTRATDTLIDKVPEELRDSARGLLRSIFN